MEEPPPEPDAGRLRAGLAFWLVTAAFLLYPELKAAFWKPAPPWVTISHTIGHLEERWHVLAPIVVAIIVIVAVHTYRSSTPAADAPARTPGGRFTLGAPPPPQAQQSPRLVSWLIYLAATAAAVTVVSKYVSTRPDTTRTFDLEYAMYGTLALFCIVIPNLFAVTRRRDVPFPTLLQTLILIEERWAVVGLALAAVLAVLVIHLGLYPWPGSLPPPSPHP